MSPRSINMVTLNAIKTLPVTIIQIRPGPGPVEARDVGAVDAAGLEAEAGAGVAPDEAAAAAGDGAGAPTTAVAGGLVVGMLAAGGAVVGVDVGVGGEVDPGVGAGAAVVGVVDEPDTCTTVNPPMFCPETWPGLVSPTKV
jgi:hypothetical protein